MERDRPFTQTFIGAVLVAIVAGVLVLLIGRTFDRTPQLDTASKQGVGIPSSQESNSGATVPPPMNAPLTRPAPQKAEGPPATRFPEAAPRAPRTPRPATAIQPKEPPLDLSTLDYVIDSAGYRRSTGWCGAVALPCVLGGREMTLNGKPLNRDNADIRKACPPIRFTEHAPCEVVLRAAVAGFTILSDIRADCPDVPTLTVAHKVKTFLWSRSPEIRCVLLLEDVTAGRHVQKPKFSCPQLFVPAETHCNVMREIRALGISIIGDTPECVMGIPEP